MRTAYAIRNLSWKAFLALHQKCCSHTYSNKCKNNSAGSFLRNTAGRLPCGAAVNSAPLMSKLQKLLNTATAFRSVHRCRLISSSLLHTNTGRTDQKEKSKAAMQTPTLSEHMHKDTTVLPLYYIKKIHFSVFEWVYLVCEVTNNSKMPTEHSPVTLFLAD